MKDQKVDAYVTILQRYGRNPDLVIDRMDNMDQLRRMEQELKSLKERSSTQSAAPTVRSNRTIHECPNCKQNERRSTNHEWKVCFHNPESVLYPWRHEGTKHPEFKAWMNARRLSRNSK